VSSCLLRGEGTGGIVSWYGGGLGRRASREVAGVLAGTAVRLGGQVRAQRVAEGDVTRAQRTD
jgi:hypothetical protein